MECLRYELGEPDDSGRRRPVPIENSEFEIQADVVIVAVGTEANPLIPQDTGELGVNKWGYIVTDDDELVLVEQYRHGVERLTLEIAGGMVDPGETPLEAARRELREETGYDAARLREVGWVHPNPAIQNTRCYTFVAEGAVPAGAQDPDSSEDLDVVRVPLADSTLVPLPDSVSDELGLLLGDVLPTGYFCADLAGVDAAQLARLPGGSLPTEQRVASVVGALWEGYEASSTRASATARRTVTGLLPTSTIRARPSASTWFSLSWLFTAWLPQLVHA